MRVLTAGTAAALTLFFCLTASTAVAATPEDAIKYRHAVMDVLGGHMSALALILTNKVDGSEYMKGHADNLAQSAAELEILFPPNSANGKTHALKKIWDNPDEFATAVSRMQTAADALAKAADSGDRKATLGAFATLGKACKGCHEDFRAEEGHDH